MFKKLVLNPISRRGRAFNTPHEGKLQTKGNLKKTAYFVTSSENQLFLVFHSDFGQSTAQDAFERVSLRFSDQTHGYRDRCTFNWQESKTTNSEILLDELV